jgi:signal transduction histidine kinase
MTHQQMTKDQRQTLDQDLATIMESLRRIANLLRACYGDMDPPVYRAEEARAAVQRLLWALERQTQTTTRESRPDRQDGRVYGRSISADGASGRR